MVAVAVLTRRFLVEYGRNPVNLLVLVVVPVFFVLVAADPISEAAEFLGGTSSAVETATTGWAAAFLAALAMYFQTRQAHSADRRLVTAGLPTAVLVIARMSTGLLVAVFVSAVALATLLLRGDVDDPLRVAAGTLMFAAIYVGIGAAVGSFVRNEVNGTVVIMLVWILDAYFGPALTSPDLVEFTRGMPTHFTTLWMVDLPSGHGGNPGDLVLALLWLVGALLGGGLLLAGATHAGRKAGPARRPGWGGQLWTSFRMGVREYRRNPALWILLVAVPFIFIWMSKLITEEQYGVVRIIENGRKVDEQFWLPDIHPGFMAPIAVASLAAVAGLFIAINNKNGDRRLVQAGMHRSALLVGRFGEVGVVVLVTAAATLAITAAAFSARQWGVYVAGIVLVGVVYALLGMCLGWFLGRVSGILIAFVVPFLDLGITQSPMLRLVPSDAAALLPGYGPFRMLIDAGLSDGFDESRGLVLGLGWTLGLAVVVAILFFTRTGIVRRRARSARHLRTAPVTG